PIVVHRVNRERLLVGPRPTLKSPGRTSTGVDREGPDGIVSKERVGVTHARMSGRDVDHPEARAVLALAVADVADISPRDVKAPSRAGELAGRTARAQARVDVAGDRVDDDRRPVLQHVRLRQRATGASRRGTRTEAQG